MDEIHAVTGANGYTGKYITRELLGRGLKVINITNHPKRESEFGERTCTIPYDFEHPERLERNLQGVEVLYNTYWVRFNHGQTTFDQAIENTSRLFQSAKKAGVRRLVHVSITNPSVQTSLPYFRGKALLEDELRNSGLSYAILRPTVLFGLEDILINNIAHLLRTFPFFVIPGNGEYRLQPVYVQDFAREAIKAGAEMKDITRDVVGPDIFTYNELVRLIADRIGVASPIIHLPPSLAIGMANLIGWWFKDVVITGDEYNGLSSNLLVSASVPLAGTHLADWLAENARMIGRRYASEIARHYLSAGG